MTTEGQRADTDLDATDQTLTPHGWSNIAFGELLSEPVRNGIYKPKPFHGRGSRIVNMGELFSYPRIRGVEMKRVELTPAEKQKVLLSEGDLIFARRSLTAEGAGKCSIVKDVPEETTFESSIIRARPDPKKADSDFLFYYFRAPYGKYLLGTILRQVAVAGITGTDLTRLLLRVPEVKDQVLVASILCSLDNKIELLFHQNQTLEAMAETLFRQWLLETPGDDWEERPLSGIATFLNGLACQKYPPANEVDKLPVLKIRELSGGITDSCDWATSSLKPEFIVEVIIISSYVSFQITV